MAKAQGVSVADVAESGKTYLHFIEFKTVKWMKCIERYIYIKVLFLFEKEHNFKT